jgi:phosphoglycolate phosphatase-like HAD superfamily hydrolase
VQNIADSRFKRIAQLERDFGTTTDKDSPKFVPREQRIATFDQDGTLWVEHPMYTQVIYCLERVPAVVKEKPELKDKEPFKTVLSGDREVIAKLSLKDLEEVLAATLSGMSVDEFQADVKMWLATAKHPRYQRPYTELTYQPMLEVLKFFRANGYKTYIVTGGGQDFVRVYAEQVYGIPPEQVVGTVGGTKYGYDKAGKPFLTKEPKLLLNDNNAGKVEGIHLMIGRRPFRKAEAANERLLKEFPKGCSLDKTHQPHISCLQRYVKTADLGKVYEAVGKVLAEEKPTAWKLKAYKYYYIPWKNIGLAGIVIEPTDDLIRYQKKLIDAVEPFTVKTGTAAAFVTTKEDPDINQPTIDYVASYVPDASGKKFNPHVTIGLASQDYLKKMLDEKFEAFTFSPVGASVLPSRQLRDGSGETQELGVEALTPCVGNEPKCDPSVSAMPLPSCCAPGEGQQMLRTRGTMASACQRRAAHRRLPARV